MAMRIDATRGLIDIQSTPCRVEMNSTLPQLKLQTTKLNIKMEIEKPQIQIDQTACFDSVGRKSVFSLTRDAAQRGMQQAMEYAAKVSGDGDTLATISGGGNPIADMAERDAFPEKEFGMVTLPAQGPEITLKRGKVKIDVQPGTLGANNGVNGEFIRGSVDVKYTPGKVETKMKQYPSIKFTYVGNNVDQKI